MAYANPAEQNPQFGAVIGALQIESFYHGIHYRVARNKCYTYMTGKTIPEDDSEIDLVNFKGLVCEQ